MFALSFSGIFFTNTNLFYFRLKRYFTSSGIRLLHALNPCRNSKEKRNWVRKASNITINETSKFSDIPK